jgi:GT2 family glycosyltransferase
MVGDREILAAPRPRGRRHEVVAVDAARRLPTPLQVATRRLRRQARGPEPDFDWLAGMCLVVSSEAFRALGGFDERYFMYCEDADLCLRISANCFSRATRRLSCCAVA